MRSILRLAAAVVPALIAAGAAEAHVGVDVHDHTGLLAGALHPLTGLDHLAAMVAVGLWAATLGRAAVLAVPAAFVGVLAAGAALGAAGVELPAVEPVIALSVVALGLLTAFAVRVPVAAAAALVGFFALFHGHAHGAEMPADAAGAAYAAGFLAATALLHAAGFAMGALVGRAGAGLVRGAGAAAALAGVAILAGVL